jgi:hypothetical protein
MNAARNCGPTNLLNEFYMIMLLFFYLGDSLSPFPATNFIIRVYIYTITHSISTKATLLQHNCSYCHNLSHILHLIGTQEAATLSTFCFLSLLRLATQP